MQAWVKQSDIYRDPAYPTEIFNSPPSESFITQSLPREYIHYKCCNFQVKMILGVSPPPPPPLQKQLKWPFFSYNHSQSAQQGTRRSKNNPPFEKRTFISSSLRRENELLDSHAKVLCSPPSFPAARHRCKRFWKSSQNVPHIKILHCFISRSCY